MQLHICARVLYTPAGAAFFDSAAWFVRPVTSAPSGVNRFCVHPTTIPTATVDLEGLTFSLYQENINMRSILLWLCALTVVATCWAQHHNNRYENFNADSVIQNDRILLAYYKCVMDKGPCTKDGKNFKRALPETLTTACGRCSPLQKVVVRKLLLGIRGKSELRFVELLDKYDPERTSREPLYNFLATGV